MPPPPVEYMQRFIDELPANFPRHLLLAGRWLEDTVGVLETAWSYPIVLDAMKIFADEYYALLGGDVYRLDADRPIPLADNWYLNYDDRWTWPEYVERSYEHGRAYIEAYHHRNGDGFLYVPVFGSDIPRAGRSSAQ